MSRPAAEYFAHNPPRECHHVIAIRNDGSERFIARRRSRVAAVTLCSQMKSAKGVKAVYVDSRQWCTCPVS